MPIAAAPKVPRQPRMATITGKIKGAPRCAPCSWLEAGDRLFVAGDQQAAASKPDKLILKPNETKSPALGDFSGDAVTRGIEA